MKLEKEPSLSSNNIGESPATSDHEPPTDYTRGWRLAALVIALGFAIFLVAIDMTIISTAIPSISSEFKSIASNGWYGSAFFLTNAAMQAPCGKLYQFFPLKRSFVISMTVFEIGSLICALAKCPATLIIGRAIAGAGAAGVAVGAYTILAVSAAPHQRSALTAIFGVSYAVASFVGPLLGGAFTTSSTWRWCFWINLPVGGFTLGTVLLIFYPPVGSAPKPASWRSILVQTDIMGVILVIGAMVCYLLALEWGGILKPWNHPDVIGTLVGFATLGLLFGLHEWYLGDTAMICRSLISRKAVLMNSSVIFFLAPSFFILLYYLPLYFQVVQGLSATASGVRTVPLVLGCGILSALSGVYMSKIGYGMPPMLLGSAMTTIACGIFSTINQHSNTGFSIGIQVLAGIGVGIACQVPIIVNQASVEQSELSSVTAITLFFQMTGGSIFLQLAQSLLTNAIATYLMSHKDSSGGHVDPMAILHVGVSEVLLKFDPDTSAVVLEAYMSGLRSSFLLATTLAGVATIFALFTTFGSIKKASKIQATKIYVQESSKTV
ncbi:MFS gliotoxin efflux transporter GliA [Trichophyton interdigitale]|uniref:MFS gliotoxin efflux transporter GliA n=1 Tax=Trichophyton interdigitale TaxID=101480 RepID=A0A9P4YIJ1_9EURO|nr:MFS gliotoxin efflux transporter GliA [Trichophyton interdigitale]KAF3894523.1 MFS gliotoxin efflux transporter GliA [Trichophyton interdigitale]KAG8208504.1 MFS gliotoxin efflux transporter GliA [Trichophyton interdigitale]